HPIRRRRTSDGRDPAGAPMTKRRKPRPRRAATPPAAREAPAARPARPASVATRAPARRRPARGARPMFGPPMGSSLAGGLAAVLATPAVIAFTGIAVLALWLLYSSAGALIVVTAGPTTSMLALPPLSSLLLDLPFARAVAAEMVFLGFTPVVAVTEEQGIVPTLRLGVRAARLHGTGLLVYLLPYVFVSVLLEAPGLRFAHVTLSPLEWGLVLIANVLHVIVLATLANRWLAI